MEVTSSSSIVSAPTHQLPPKKDVGMPPTIFIVATRYGCTRNNVLSVAKSGEMIVNGSIVERDVTPDKAGCLPTVAEEYMVYYRKSFQKLLKPAGFTPSLAEYLAYSLHMGYITADITLIISPIEEITLITPDGTRNIGYILEEDGKEEFVKAINEYMESSKLIPIK